MAHSSRRRRHRSGPRKLIFTSIWFCLLGLNWVLLIFLGLKYARPHPLALGDKVIGGMGILVALFYFWVALSVHQRRHYIWDIAIACAGLSLLGFPFGTILALVLIGNLLDAKNEFLR